MGKCKPTRYAVITGKDTITYGWRCKTCGIPSKRYPTEELRDQRLREHKKGAKRS